MRLPGRALPAAFVMVAPTTTFLRRGGPVPAGYQVAIAGLSVLIVLGIRPLCGFCWASGRSQPDRSPAITNHAAAGPRPVVHSTVRRRSRPAGPTLSPSPRHLLMSSWRPSRHSGYPDRVTAIGSRLAKPTLAMAVRAQFG